MIVKRNPYSKRGDNNFVIKNKIKREIKEN